MNMPIALALVVAGVVLLIFGLGSTDSIQNAFSRMFSGHLTDKTIWMIVGGCVLTVLGIFGCYRSARRA
jgi:protein-S-isoprenylcysteine O-methyltransferase Ste14